MNQADDDARKHETEQHKNVEIQNHDASAWFVELFSSACFVWRIQPVDATP